MFRDENRYDAVPALQILSLPRPCLKLPILEQMRLNMVQHKHWKKYAHDVVGENEGHCVFEVQYVDGNAVVDLWNCFRFEEECICKLAHVRSAFPDI